VRRLAALLFLCLLALPTAAAAWTWPVDGRVLRPFTFDPAHPYAAGQHRGLDIAAAAGSAVRAPAGGTVTFAGTVPDGGKTLSIETHAGYTATLLHLGSLGVARGAHVDEGGKVATGGGEGFVYFGLRTTGNPQGYVDPLAFLPAPDASTPTVPAPEPAMDVAPAVGGAAASPPAPAAVTSGAPGASSAAPQPAETAAAPSARAADPATASGVPAPPLRAVTTPAVPEPAHASAPAGGAAGGVASAPYAPRSASAGAGGLVSTDRLSPANTGLVALRSFRVARRVGSLGAPAIPAAVDGAVVAPAAGPARRSGAGTDRSATTDRSRRDVARDGAAAAATSGVRMRASATTAEDVSKHRLSTGGVTIVIVATAILGVIVVLGLRRRSIGPQAPRIIEAHVRDDAEEDPRRAGVAVRERTASSRPRRWLRSARGHLCAVPPAEGQRRDDGERDRRAWHAGHGLGRPRGSLAA